MKMVIQVVKNATLSVDEKVISKINKGLVVYFCVEKNDDIKNLDYFAKKIASLRVFPDSNDKTNLSVQDIKGEILLISQFTLAGDFYHGNRPSFSNAEEPEKAKIFYEKLAKILNEKYSLTVKLGAFGEHMVINKTEIGPFTAYLEK